MFRDFSIKDVENLKLSETDYKKLRTHQENLRTNSKKKEWNDLKIRKDLLNTVNEMAECLKLIDLESLSKVSPSK